MKPRGVTNEHITLRAFPFSLKDKAKDWLYNIPPESVTTWNDVKKLFLEKFFPASKATNIRKEIYGIRQCTWETLFEYWERFKGLCSSCPHHQISEQHLIQYFYEGLLPMDRSMVDAASGGSPMDRSMVDAASGGSLVDKTPTDARQLISLVDKTPTDARQLISTVDKTPTDARQLISTMAETPTDARQLISTMAENSQQYGTRADGSIRRVNDVSSSQLENKISDLTTLVRQMAVGQMQSTGACGICSFVGHPTDMYPTLQNPSQELNAIGGFSSQPNRKYDPFSNQYNPGWRDHPNLSYGNQGVQPRFQNQNFRQFQAPQQSQPQALNSGMSLDEIFKALANNTQQFQQETRAGIQQLGNQISQLATSVSKLEAQALRKLPSQTEVNPKENVSAITLRSGKQLQPESSLPVEEEKEEKSREENESIANENSKVSSESSVGQYNSSLPPFPSRLAKSNEEEHENQILETFRKVEINIPLLEAITQIPKYAKFLKELCTNKRKLKSKEKIILGKNVSAMISNDLPRKCKDPGMFTLPCIIGNKKIKRAMLDLGASINVMPFSIYQSLNMNSLQETSVVVQLADRSCVHPIGVIEDVLVQVNGLVFPVDFYVLKMNDDAIDQSTPILLGRTFMKTAKTKIDVDKGILSVEFNGEIAKFNISDAMKYPDDYHSLYHVDIIDSIVQDVFKDVFVENLLDLEVEFDLDEFVDSSCEVL
ncbi:uncharacterized protein LOC116013076 [Ipomoea triloba]|uniref:uncharacterized protein LOC116013076 n=1 Tax=Ipomoea triloba TaxID=35885 RepID=UPI00125D4832|nr:uncharacterized protein LOC116013076 [Ipomoea triloba]